MKDESFHWMITVDLRTHSIQTTNYTIEWVPINIKQSSGYR